MSLNSLLRALAALFRGKPSRPQPRSSAPSPAPPPPPSAPSTPGRLTKIAGPFHPRLYSYWANSYVRNGSTFTFAAKLYQQPVLYEIHPDGRVSERDELKGFTSETESWYWDSNGWLYFPDGPFLARMNPFGGGRGTMLEVGHGSIWQAHSSADGQVHSATHRDSDGRKIGTVVNYRGTLIPIPAIGDLDESSVDDSGEYVTIKETLPDGLANRVITLASGDEWLIRKSDGALGHSDCGHGFMVGEWSPPQGMSDNGQCVYWDLRTRTRRHLFNTWNLGHVSIRGRRALISNATTLTLDLLDLDSGPGKVIYMHDIDASGNYDAQVRANLSPCGQRATFMMHGDLHVLEL
jgi:hypothetical protein